jgi:hypothetical protein
VWAEDSDEGESDDDDEDDADMPVEAANDLPGQAEQNTLQKAVMMQQGH